MPPALVSALALDGARAAERARWSLVLDVRSAAEFARGHLPGSGNFELHEFAERRSELPPRDAAVLVVAASPADAAAAAGDLVERGFKDVKWLDGHVGALASLVAGPEPPSVCWVKGPPARLWRSNPWLAEVLPSLPLGGRACDLASGSGRDAVTLALHGYEVEAWDYDAHALVRANALAAREGVRIATLIVDLEQETPPLPEAAWDLIVCFRFLHRPLMPAIARALRPGGHLVYETFRAGQERFGKPTRPRFLLEPGELRDAFSELEVLRYDEPSPAAGPWTARLLARRPDVSRTSEGSPAT